MNDQTVKCNAIVIFIILLILGCFVCSIETMCDFIAICVHAYSYIPTVHNPLCIIKGEETRIPGENPRWVALRTGFIYRECTETSVLTPTLPGASSAVSSSTLKQGQTFHDVSVSHPPPIDVRRSTIYTPYIRTTPNR